MGLLRKFRCFGRAKIKARAHSRLNFREAKTSKPHGKACYAGYGDHFVIIELLRRTFIVDRARCKWTGTVEAPLKFLWRMKDLLLCVGVVVKTLNLEISRSHLAD